jgi:AcrR family transcriptional regulator
LQNLLLYAMLISMNVLPIGAEKTSMRRTKEEAMKTRGTVLRAAAQVITRSGGSAFTIEAVAQEAGVTKGGVLHHFPSKEALVEGLIDQVTAMFNAQLTTELAAEPAGQPGRWLRAYIRTIFSVQYDEMNLIPALSAAVTADHQILNRIRDGFRESQEAAIQDGLDPTLATIIRTAVDGIAFKRALGLNVLDADTSQSVYAALLRLTYPTGVS